VPRVLIIDDEPSIRFALRRWFERQGWVVGEANEGAAALNLLAVARSTETPQYDVIISDLRMPGVSGDQLHARLSAEYPELLSRLVFTSGDNVTSPPIDSVLFAHPNVLQKPFEFDTLRALVESIAGPM
jgi:CheY-like chemotaxis protein